MKKNLQWEYEDCQFDNRVANLMWTVCGDYTSQMAQDEKISLSKNSALYYGITAGGRRKYVDWEKINAYIGSRISQGFNRKKLQKLVFLAINPMVISRIARERPGVIDIQKQACHEMVEILKTPRSSKFLDQVEFFVLEILADRDDGRENAVAMLSRQILKIAAVETTEDLIRAIDALYIKWQNLTDVAPLNFLADENAGMAWLDTESFVNQSVEELFEKKTFDQREGQAGQVSEKADVVMINQDDYENLQKQVAFFNGQSYLEAYQTKKLENILCKGAHRDCQLHFTEGVLRSTGASETRKKFAVKDQDHNRAAYQDDMRVYIRTIKRLHDALERTLILERSTYPVASDGGNISPRKLWRVGRVPASRLFERFESNDKGGFVVDLLLDSSMSQKGREARVAIQAYIIARALIETGIPCRVTGFNSFLNFTVMKRFRDYDESAKATENIFEYSCESSNRDGLAIRSVCEGLYRRDEENKILIVLSDGKPNDVRLQPKNKTDVFRGILSYSGGIAMADTAKEVRIARHQGVSVLGVFTGDERDLDAEKHIYGKDFVYTRTINHFADIVITYLKRVISM